MSTSKEKQNNNKTKRSKTAKNLYKNKTKIITENQLAVEETKKLYQKYYEAPNQLFISQLKTDTMNIYLSNYKLNDISVINRILGKYKYIKNMTLSPIDPFKTNSTKLRNKNSREPITEGEKVKLEKEAKDKQIEYSHIINKITLGIGKHLFENEKLESFSLLNFQIDEKIAKNLSSGIINNKSIKIFKMNNCQIDIESYEILLKGLFNHPNIEKLDLQNNNLNDKYGNMIGRIISRQTDRRDQVIWSFALRNEFPKNKDYKNGLISINLNGNNLSSYSADCITTAIASDQYMRSIILSNNKFDLEACKKFIYMLRRNMTLLNIDLSSNPGYNDNIQKRLIIKMSKNIKNLYIKFKKNEIDENEFESYKKYINSSLFFKIDIPEDVIQKYNNDDYNKIIEDKTNNINKNIIKDNNKENGMVLKELKEDNDLNKNNNIENIYKDKTKSGTKSPNKPKKNSDQDTKKLIEENLSLKKQILELKAENIKNLTRKNITIPNKYKNESLNKNFKQAEELLDKLNNLMKEMNNEVDQKKEEQKKNIEDGKKSIDNTKNNNIDNKIKIKNIVLNDKKEENTNDNLNIEKKKEKPKEKEKKEIKLNLDDNNKITFKKEESNIKKNNKHINNNFFKNNFEKENINKNEKNKDKIKKSINNNKKEEILNNINKKNNRINLHEKEELKENDEIKNFDKNEAIMQHRIYFEQLKKEYAARGLKFEMEDYLELLQNQELEDDEEEEEYEGF